MLKRHSAFILLVTVLFVVCALRIHLLSAPLERDEGEYAYSGQMLLQGVVPFSQAYNMKMPGIYVAYAAVMACFGQTSSGIHFGLVLINLLCSIALFFIGKRLYNQSVGSAAGVSFAVMSISSSVLGLSANSEHFVVLFALFGLLLFLKASDRQSIRLLLLSGVLFGACFLMKQHGAAFILCMMLLVFKNGLKGGPGDWKNRFLLLFVFCAGVSAPLVLCCLWLWLAGVFGRFWFWTFAYAHEYVSQVGIRQGLGLFSAAFRDIVAAGPLFWVLALCGWLSLLFHKNPDAGGKRALLAAFVIASLAAICPGFYFRQHYFILLLPAVSLLSGIGLDALCRGAARYLPVKHACGLFFGATLVAALAVSLTFERRVLFQLPPSLVTRFLYGSNPFLESCVIADSLRAWTTPDEKIAVLGSEPQIFFYAHRRSATGYIYTYALMENHPFALDMQKSMIREIESNNPAYIVFVNVPTSWLMRRGSPTEIFEWFNRYQRAEYEIFGIADMMSFETTVYRWGEDARTYDPRASCWLAVFKRKAPARKT